MTSKTRQYLATRPMAAPLFRSEAVQAVHKPPQARVLLRPLVGSGWMTAIALAVTAALIAYLLFGSYTRRATVAGHLAPAAGVVRLVAPSAGWVLEQRAKQGQAVKAGDVLFVLSTDRPTVDGGDYQGRVVESLRRRATLLEESSARLQTTEQEERAGLQRRIALLEGELPLVERQAAEQQRRAKMAEDASAQWRALFEQKVASRDEWTKKETELSEQRSRVHALQRERLALGRELNEARLALATLHKRTQDQQQLLTRDLEQLQQQLAESEARRRIVVTAPRAGTLTLVFANAGMSVDAQRPLAQLTPDDEPLVARLYAPSRAIGFVRPKTPVRLRYEAFPHERYGMQAAEVIDVASTPAQGDELSPWLGGGASGTGPAGEPLYPITVRLNDARFPNSAGGETLRAGLRVEADLLFESRRLIEWMFSPALKVP